MARNLGIHHIETDETRTPRWGIFIVWYDNFLFELELVVAIAGIRRHRQLVDFRTRTVLARKVYWARLTLLCFRKLPKGWRRLQFARGTHAHHDMRPAP